MVSAQADSGSGYVRVLAGQVRARSAKDLIRTRLEHPEEQWLNHVNAPTPRSLLQEAECMPDFGMNGNRNATTTRCLHVVTAPAHVSSREQVADVTLQGS